MEDYEIVGVQSYSFTNDARQTFSGSRFHAVSLGTGGRKSLTGRYVETFSASMDLMASWAADGYYTPKVGDKVTVVFNRFGKLSHFVELA